MAAQTQQDVNFTVFIRLPFPRGDFVDPPPVEWNAAKDQALWDILSRPSKADDIDWKALADSFNVTLHFLLQQAAWLYDRQLSKVRAQMRRVGTTHPNAPSPAPGSVSGSTALGGQSAVKTAPGVGSRAPSRLAMLQKDAYPQRAGFQRTNSATSLSAARALRDSSRNTTPTVEAKEPKWDVYGRPPSFRREQTATAPPPPPPPRSPTLEDDLSPSSSESESDDDDYDETNMRAPRFKRFGKFSTHKPSLRDDEDDEDDSPAFLPLNRENIPAPREIPGQDLNATLRLSAEHPGIPRRHTTERPPITRKSMTTESSASSISSGVAVSRSQTENPQRTSQVQGVLSPRRTAELARLSSRRSNASGKDVSDGTPSMGSSFSDLDDASVTQSALEEALLSNMQHGGMASRMSTISQALRSRYL